jgi:hypothetical protein
MILSGMLLFFDTTHSRFIGSHENKKILGVKAQRLIMHNDFHVRQMLGVSTHLILALDNQDSRAASNPISLSTSLEVEV